MTKELPVDRDRSVLSAVPKKHLDCHLLYKYGPHDYSIGLTVKDVQRLSTALAAAEAKHVKMRDALDQRKTDLVNARTENLNLSARIVELEGALRHFAELPISDVYMRVGGYHTARVDGDIVGVQALAKAALSSPHPRGSDTRDDNNQWPEFNRER